MSTGADIDRPVSDQAPPRPARPEPIEQAEAELLAGRARALAKGWLLTLLERAPLEAAAAIPAAEVAADGPALCAAFARALGSDRELDRLRPDGDLAPAARRVGRLAGARDGAGVLAAVDALRACVWASALEARRGRSDGLPALAERLAAVALVVAGTALADAAVLAGAAGEEERSAPVPAPDPPAEVNRPHGTGAPRGAARLADASSRDDAPGAAPADAPSASAPAAVPRLDPDAPAPAGVTRLPLRPSQERVVADMDDGELWIEALERHVDRVQREGGGLALLRVELVDGERIAAAAPDDHGVPYGRLAQAIRRAIRRQDLVASDKQGRAWVIAPGVGRAGALALAERVCAGIERGEPVHGEPLRATIGYAVYGEDGRDAAELIERAEEAMMAASAAGLRIGEAAPSGDGEQPGPRLVR